MALKRQPRQIPKLLHSLKTHFDLQPDNNNNKKKTGSFFRAKSIPEIQASWFWGDDEILHNGGKPPNTKPTHLYLTFNNDND